MKFCATLATIPTSIALLSLPMSVSAADAIGPAWSYRTNDAKTLSPDKWEQGYPTCAGKNQSPINIMTDKLRGQKKTTPLTFSGDCSSFNLVPHDVAYKWKVTSSTCKLKRGADTFSLLQFHPHIDSEYTINEKQQDAEFHFVHQKDDSNDLLVVGLMLQQTNVRDPWITSVFDSLANVNQSVRINYPYADALKKEMSEGKTFNYGGSLTTPPCMEGMEWCVIQSPVDVSRLY